MGSEMCIRDRSNIDLYLLYRYYSQGAFSEFGVMRSQLRNVEHLDPQSEFTDFTDVTSNYDDYLSVVFGGGAFIAGTERTTLMLGVRIVGKIGCHFPVRPCMVKVKIYT